MPALQAAFAPHAHLVRDKNCRRANNFNYWGGQITRWPPITVSYTLEIIANFNVSAAACHHDDKIKWVSCGAMGRVLLLATTLVASVSALYYDTPEDCSWTPMPGREVDSVFLTCRLSSINSRLERTNFSVIPSDSTRGLRIQCEDQSLGHLEPHGFSSLVNLEQLEIVGCALESVPAGAFHGLASLKRLTIVAGPGLGVMRVEQGALANLSGLHHLDLSQNSIREFPSSELCSLDNLMHLNVSRNEIGSTFDLALSTRPNCLENISLLDLSQNEITSLEAGSLPSLSGLSELRINDNFIRFISPDFFANSSLQTLDMSNNQINHLPPHLLTTLPLRSLFLGNNTLSSLPIDAFTGQKQLERLSLRGNLLTGVQLKPELATDLLSLLHLDLSANMLETLDPAFLAALPSLQVLKVSENQLSSLQMPPSLFQLTELNMSGNQLIKVEARSLVGLEALTHLNLANNQLQSIHSATFRNASSILVLDLSSNKLQEVPESLKYLTNLQTLDIGKNFISNIMDSPLTVMEGLWRLQIHGNQIRNISHSVFSNLHTLQILDMSANQIENIDRGAFDQNKLLRAIRLDGNLVQEIEGIFTHLPDLIWLNVSDNRITTFDFALVPRTLHWLDISHNKVSELGNYFDLSADLALSYLNAGFNRLKTLGPVNVPDNVETLLLNDNSITEVAPYTFFRKAKLVKVDLTVNGITGIGQTALRLPSDMADLPQFLLGGNPVLCDCAMQWFKTINDNNSIQRYPFIADLESIYCRLVYTTEQAFIPLVEARPDQFLCQYQTHCFSLCQCCVFDSCDCKMTCPDGCSCYHDNSWTKNIIQCSSSQFTSLPDSMPMDATEIFLDGNQLQTLQSHTFIGRKNLRVLHLNNSNIDRIENQTFNGLKSLTVLHLENNNVKSLQGFEFSGLSHLRELYLQNNQITSIHNNTFKVLKSLEVLFLQGNTIVDYPIWQLASNPYLVSLKLAQNLWSCECEYVQRFRGWLKVFGQKVTDMDELSCISNEAVGIATMRMAEYNSSPCVESNGKAIANGIVQEQEVRDYTPVMIATLASFALILLLALCLFIFRHSLRVWIHSKYGVRVFDSLECKLESGKLFDCYISYSPADDVFVRQVLAHDLEVGNKYRVCLHHRDLPNNTVISDTVVRAGEAAKRSIVVLSPNFLKTEWARYDFKSGLLQAVNQGSKKVIFVLVGSLENCQLDPNLRLLLKNNIVLQWGDALFWEKMRYSLPDLQQAQPQSPSTYSSYRVQPQHKLQGSVNHALHM